MECLVWVNPEGRVAKVTPNNIYEALNDLEGTMSLVDGDPGEAGPVEAITDEIDLAGLVDDQSPSSTEYLPPSL